MAKHSKHESTVSPKMSTHITITKAENGFTVSRYGEKGEQTMVAKDVKEMMGMMHKMLGMKEHDEEQRLKAKFR